MRLAQVHCWCFVQCYHALYSAIMPSANYYVYYAIFHFHKDIAEFHKYVQLSFN